MTLLVQVSSFASVVAGTVGAVAALIGVITSLSRYVFVRWSAKLNLNAGRDVPETKGAVDPAENLAQNDYVKLLKDLEAIKANLLVKQSVTSESKNESAHAIDEKIRRYDQFVEKIREAGNLLFH